jgi:hypothetical protein
MVARHSGLSPVDFSAAIYGSIVNCFLEMTEDADLANSKLVALGYRVGRRLGHDLASDLDLQRIECPTDVITSVIVKNWVSVLGDRTISWGPGPPDSLVIEFRPTPFTQYVNIPESFSSLTYTSALAGVIRGIFEVFHYSTTVTLADNDGPETVILVHVNGVIPTALREQDA